ncbi:LAFA_0F21814g1_1 [Lachancea sp. 'fantastica']|nr:LAFA_0F21814g1_1 [Lachancea sp. 'fantastica']
MKAKHVLNAVLDGVDYFCRKSDSKTLKQLAISIGSQVGTTKTSIRHNILNQCELLQQLADVRKSRGSLDITAIDIGLENFAYTRLSWNAGKELPELKEWNKIRLSSLDESSDIVKTPFTPKFLTGIGLNLTDILTKRAPDFFAIERQRTRTLGSAAVPDPIIKANALEHVLFMSLKSKNFYTGGLDYLVESSDPRRMTDYWCQLIPVDDLMKSKNGLKSMEGTSKSKSSTFTKIIKIALVRSMIEQQSPEKFTVSAPLQKRLENYKPQKKYDLFEALQLGPMAGTPKQDDLADCMLHGLAWLEWLKTYEDLASVIAVSGEDPAGLKAFKEFNKSTLQRRTKYAKNCIIEL